MDSVVIALTGHCHWTNRINVTTFAMTQDIVLASVSEQNI